MLPDRVSNPGPLTYESGALPIALRGPTAIELEVIQNHRPIRSSYLSSEPNRKKQLVFPFFTIFVIPGCVSRYLSRDESKSKPGCIAVNNIEDVGCCHENTYTFAKSVYFGKLEYMKIYFSLFVLHLLILLYGK